MKILVVLCVLIAVVLGGQNKFVEESFASMDENKDGFLEKKEMIKFIADGFRKLAVMDAGWLFDDLDTNKDNYVTRDEMAMHSQKKTVKQMEEAIKDGTAKQIDQFIYLYETEKFKICDKNNDGKLSRNEHWYFLNSAAVLPRFEQENMWGEYDKNGDGKVLFEEFHNPDFQMPDQSKEQQKAADQEFFNSRDLNHDGILEFSEIQEMTAPNKERQAEGHIDFVMSNHDLNKDHKLSKQEYENSYNDMSLFEGAGSQPPKPTADDIEGTPVEPPSRLDYSKLYTAGPRDEL